MTVNGVAPRFSESMMNDIRIAVVQHGDHIDGMRIADSGQPETYFGMIYSVRSLRSLFGGYAHLVISLNGGHYEVEQDLDLSRSGMIGDMPSDVHAGRNAGCRGTVLVRTGSGIATPQYATSMDHWVPILLDAARMIVRCWSRS